MSEENNEAKVDFDQQADAILDNAVVGDPSESSSENEPESTSGKEPGQEESAGAEPEKTEQIKTVEADESLSVEDKIAKVKEILGEDEEAVDAYIKEKGYHNDPAWQKREELISKLRKESEAKAEMSEEDRTALDEFKTFRNSPEYIKTSMKSQGYTDEAIAKKLQESGFETESNPEDDVALVVEKLGVNLDAMSPTEKSNTMANIRDVVKIAEVLVNDRLSKILPKELGPLQEHIQARDQESSANAVTETMKSTVEKEGVLDFKKDIEPALNKFMDDNPDALQQDVFDHFKAINHSLTIDRLKIGKSQIDRDGKRGQVRHNVPVSSSPAGLPEKTGNFDKDADAFFDTIPSL